MDRVPSMSPMKQLGRRRKYYRDFRYGKKTMETVGPRPEIGESRFGVGG